MKLNKILMTCAVSVLLCGTGSVFAQDSNNDNGPGGRPPGNNQTDQGGQQQRRNRNGGPGNFDPAQMQQRMMDNIREQLGFTNDTEWSAVEPLVQKVMDARRDVGFGGMGRMFGRNNRNGGGGNRSGMFGQASPEQEALQTVLDNNAPSGQIKDLLAKYKSSQKSKQAKLEAAQSDLKKVLTVKQEAEATLLGLVN